MKEHRPTSTNQPIFLPTVAYNSHGANAISVGVADVNGDNKPDLLVLNECGGSHCASSILVLRGNGDGTFHSGGIIRSIGAYARALVVGDVNGDGKADVVVNNLFGSVVFVLLGTGDGNFQPAVPYSSGGIFPQALAIADVNGDGKPDLLVTNEAGAIVNGNYSTLTVSVLLGNGNGTFQDPVAYDVGFEVPSIVAADLNGDSQPDLVVATGCPPGNCTGAHGVLAVLINKGNGTFQPALTYGSGTNDAISVAVGDVNHDGKPDLIAGNDSGSAGVLLGNGDGTFQPALTYSSGSGLSISVEDVNGDGKLDLLTVGGGSVFVLVGNGNGTFQPALTFDAGGTYAASLAIADLNRDGQPDLAVADQVGCSYCGKGAVGVLLKNTGVTKTAVTTSGSPSHAGQPVTFTATVTTYGVIPDGDLVNFYDGKKLMGSAALSGGTAMFTTSSLSVRTHTIKGTYLGDDFFQVSTGKVTQVVEP